MHAGFAPDRNLKSGRQRIGDRDADTMQAAGERIRTAGALVELAAGMQAGEDNLDCRHLFFRMHADRNATPVILDADATVDILRDHDLLGVAAQRFIGGVVDDFLDDVQRIFGAGVHAGALLDRFQAFQDADGGFAVVRLWCFFSCHAW